MSTVQSAYVLISKLPHELVKVITSWQGDPTLEARRIRFKAITRYQCERSLDDLITLNELMDDMVAEMRMISQEEYNDRLDHLWQQYLMTQNMWKSTHRAAKECLQESTRIARHYTHPIVAHTPICRVANRFRYLRRLRGDCPERGQN